GWSPGSTWTTRSPTGRWRSSSTSCCAAGGAPPSKRRTTMTELTPSQTVGPFLHIGLPWEDGPLAVAQGTPGAFTITGRVTDGSGEPLPDAMVETWQAGADGQRGFGRCATGADGEFHVFTVRPRAQPARDGGTEAPHIDVSVFSRGLLTQLVTRIYF